MPNLGLIAFLALIAAPATRPDWTAFLSLAGAILGGCIAAIIGAWANSRLRDREAKKAEDRERKGLMSLIFAEYGNNYPTLRLLANEPSLLDDRTLTNLQTAVWDDTKVRLALLLPRDAVIALVLYYGQIQSTLDNIKDEEMIPEIKRIMVSASAEQAIKYGKAAMKYSSKYLFVDQPEHSEDVHEAFVREAQRIMNERLPERPDG
jgi:hypothetical protein